MERQKGFKMKAYINYKGTEFELKNVKRIAIEKNFDYTKGSYRKFIFFLDRELGLFEYPLTDIKELQINE